MYISINFKAKEMRKRTKVTSFLSTADHLDMVARAMYEIPTFVELCNNQREEAFKRFKQERIDSVHINDKWKEIY